MKHTYLERNEMTVDLSEGIFVRTLIPKENHAALRSGFAGYPANPRWNVNKYHAWKMGSQWRNDLSTGKMVVRSNDSLLVPVSEVESEECQSLQKPSSSHYFLFPSWNFSLPRFSNPILN
jgi:hypothetical protein